MSKSRKSSAPATEIDNAAIDARTGLTVPAANATRTLAARIRRLGTYVAVEPYRGIGKYVSRYTFTGKFATGGFNAVLAKLREYGFDGGEPEQLPADHPLSEYSGKSPAFTVRLTGRDGTSVAGFVITLYGSDNPENGLIPFHVITHYPVSAATAPKQSDKSTKPTVSVSFDPPTVNT